MKRSKSYWGWVKQNQREETEPREANMDKLSDEDKVNQDSSPEIQRLKYKVRCLLENDEYRKLLTARESQVFELTFKHGLSLRQAADILKIHFTTVDEILNNAISKVRSELELNPLQNGDEGV